MSRDHRKLKAFALADQLVIRIYQATRDFPREETFALTSQLRRSAVSVAANIVEGAARESHREYLNFVNIAFGSLRETGYYIGLATRLGYLSPEIGEQLEEQYSEVARVTAALIRSLKKFS
ncbi:MAG: four helix bundle protein [Planctomycetes bacterium]|nr:four helix bundle protein [Planctomycetota bacterium]